MVPNNTTQFTGIIFDCGIGKLRRRSRSSTDHRSGSFSDDRARPRVSLCNSKSPSVSCDSFVHAEPAGDVSGLPDDLSVLHQCSCRVETTETTENLPCIENLFHSDSYGALLFPGAKDFSPQNASFHHSTPDERDSAVASQMISGNESESMCLSRDECPYEDIDSSAVVGNTLSWHDTLDVDPGSSRSCISLDDSLFLSSLNVEGSHEAEVLATCTAVSSMEQLEQEVAGVLSDCGDMERCVGMLRRRDSIKAVVGRYSLGVADSVLASDNCCRWQDSTESPVVDDPSSSSSVGIVWQSGFLWDDDEFDLDSPRVSHAPVSRRATRSLSPLPAVKHQQNANSYRASLGAYDTTRMNGNKVGWKTDIDNNTSAELAPCIVYDVNRRLSGRIQVQHVNN